MIGDLPSNFIAIELSPIDAEQFVLFQKYYTQFKQCIDEGLFEVRGGRGIIDFKDDGSIDRVIRVLYSKKQSFPQAGDNYPV